jgi:hypothetical protein
LYPFFQNPSNPTYIFTSVDAACWVLEDAEDRHRSVIAGAGVAVGLVMTQARHARLSTRGHDGGRSHSEVQKAAEAEQMVWNKFQRISEYEKSCMV